MVKEPATLSHKITEDSRSSWGTRNIQDRSPGHMPAIRTHEFPTPRFLLSIRSETIAASPCSCFPKLLQLERKIELLFSNSRAPSCSIDGQMRQQNLVPEDGS